MADARRSFVKILAGAAGAFLFLQDQPPVPTPRPKIPVYPPEPAEKPDSSSNPDSASIRVDLSAQERELRATLDQLFAKVRDLKNEIDQMRPAAVFSVPVFKQTQEIEKRAKRLKGYAKV